MNLRLYTLFSILIISLNLFSQTKVRIYGYVIDENNRGIDLANVYVQNTTKGTVTNESGFYDMTIDVKDSATIVYSMIGYRTIRHTISAHQRVIQISVELMALTKEMKSVDIVAQRRQTSNMDYIDPSKNRLIPNTTGGIESLLINFAGVSQNNELSSQYNVRGGNYDENAVYVNGIEIYRPLLIRAGQQEGLSFVNPDMVKSLGFSAGGFDAKYGDKMSSVLDITYKKPKHFESSASVSLLGASYYVGTANKKFTQIHGIRYKTSRLLLGTLDTKGEYSPTFIDYQTYMTYKLKPKWELTFLGNFSQNTYDFIPISRETDFGTYQTTRNLMIYYDGSEKDLFRTSFGAFTLNYRPHKNLKLSLIASAFNTNERETYDIAGDYTLSEVKKGVNPSEKIGATLGIGKNQLHARNRLDATVANISHSGVYKFGANNVQWGAKLQLEHIRDNINEWEWRDSSGYSLPYSDQEVNLYYNMKSHNLLTSFRTTGYIQDTYKKKFDSGLLSMTGGVRGNWWSFNKELLVSPRFSMSFFPNWKHDYGFRFATGVYYQAPFYKEIRDTATDALGNVTVNLNHNIKAPRSLQFLLGGDHYFRAWGRPFKFTTEAYLKLADRIISYTVDNVKITYSGKNDGKAYTAGLDMKLFGELVPGTDSWINFSIMDSKEKLDDDSYMKNIYDSNGNITGTELYNPGWIPRPDDQRYSFSMMFQDYLPNNPKYKMQLKLIWSDGLPFGPPHNIAYRDVFRAPPYRRVDIGASRVLVNGKDKWMEHPWLKHVKSIWLNLEVFNLLDFKNVNSYYWVTDIYGQQLATPNYLTGRQLNFRLIVDFK